MKATSKNLLFLCCFFAVACIITYSCSHAPYVLPVSQRTGDPDICFERDILPIFVANCSGCHSSSSRAGGYALDNYTDIVKKGIVPGNPAASRIWEAIAIKTPGVSAMPPGGHGLGAADLNLLRRWIQTGAIDSGVSCSVSRCDSNTFTYSGAVAPLMQRYCTGCHSGPSATGGSLADYASVKEAAVNGRMVGNIEHRAGYNAMPTAGITLTACEIAQVKKWVAAGAPNN